MRIELGGPRWGNDAGWWFRRRREEESRAKQSSSCTRSRSGSAAYLIDPNLRDPTGKTGNLLRKKAWGPKARRAFTWKPRDTLKAQRPLRNLEISQGGLQLYVNITWLGVQR
jgi:hypothetical protein